MYRSKGQGYNRIKKLKKHGTIESLGTIHSESLAKTEQKCNRSYI